MRILVVLLLMLIFFTNFLFFTFASIHSLSPQQICSVTLHRELCEQTLLGTNDDPQGHLRRTLTAATKATRTLKTLAHMLLLRQPKADMKKRRALRDCRQLMDVTLDQLASAATATSPPLLRRTLLSAAVTNHDTCMDSLSEATAVPDDALHVRHVADRAIRLCSNALAMATHYHDDYYDGHVRQPVDNGLPTWLSESDRLLLEADDVALAQNVDAVVAADGSGDFKSVSAAVAKAPKKATKRYVILVKAGVYKENVEVPKSKTNIMVVGQGMDRTIISGDRNVADNYTTFRSATFAAVGAGFIAKNITFRNTAGWAKHQAVALRVGGDKAAFQGCKMEGYQDTLYAHSLRQFYGRCIISGTVDFIFGNAAAVFQKCTIVARKPGPQQKNTVTAQGRLDPNQDTGISIHDCTIAADSELAPVQKDFPTYLGRPWKEYSRTVVMQSDIGDVINPAGWLQWNDSDFALKTLFYAEYQNSGAGAGTAGRVKWPGYHVLKSQVEALPYTVGQFIAGDEWLPDTDVDYVSGFIN